MRDKLAQIEKRRSAAGISREQLARTAGVSATHYRRLMHGDHRPGEALVARLTVALARLCKAPDARVTPVQTIYRLCVVIVCVHDGDDPAEVIAQDPARRATFDPVWLRAAEVRRKALYLANVVCGIPQRQLAQAAGMTPPAVHLALRAIEDQRDDIADDPLLHLVETAIGGL